ncbi:MAG: hypothetical protein ACRD6X_05185 [Pyrinomonadaceae bacterium]
MIEEIESLSKQRYVSPFSIAIAYEGIGNTDKALELLNKAFDERSDAMAILWVHPFLESLHRDQRFIDLARKVGFKP